MTEMDRLKTSGQSTYVRLDPKLREKLDAYIEKRKEEEPIKITINSVINFALKKFLEGEEKNK